MAAPPAAAWQRLSADAGAKGERLYDWARVRLFRWPRPPWDHWLLIRRHRRKADEVAYHVVFGPTDTMLADLARLAGQRWTIEECFETATQEVGLADYDVRSWHGWYRHITLAMVALAFLAATRVRMSAKKGAMAAQGCRWRRSVNRKSAGSSPASAASTGRASL